MKRILTTTALALTMGSTAFAASHTSGNETGAMNNETPFMAANGDMSAELRASDIIGMRIYTSDQPVEESRMSNPAEGWNDVGEVNDVLLARDGSMEGILLDIGGFLGIGEKQIAVRMDELNFVTDGDTDGDFFVVFNADQATLENAPEFDATGVYSWLDAETEQNAQAMNENMQENTDMAATGSAATTDSMGGNTNTDGTMAEQDMAATESTGDPMPGEFETAAMNDLTAEELTGTPAFDQNGERVGEVSELLIDQEEITDVIVDFGGFLGLGEKSVRLAISDVNIERNTQDQGLRVTVNVTQSDIEGMEEYDG